MGWDGHQIPMGIWDRIPGSEGQATTSQDCGEGILCRSTQAANLILQAAASLRSLNVCEFCAKKREFCAFSQILVENPASICTICNVEKILWNVKGCHLTDAFSMESCKLTPRVEYRVLAPVDTGGERMSC